MVAAVAAGTGSGAARQASPSPACSSTYLPTWSPDGTQIAFVGRRLRHGPLAQRAICVANANGTNAAPLPHTLCKRTCRLDLIDGPNQLFWVKPNLLLFGDDFRIFTIPVGGEPQYLGKQPGSFEEFSVDSAGDRVAAGHSDCPQVHCAGPVTVLDVPSGSVVGRVGGATKIDNITPSISPDGTQVAFVRGRVPDGPALGIWAASVNGSHLRRLVAAGESPLWSPDGAKIAYTGTAPPGSSLRLVSPRGGKSRALVAKRVLEVFGWSPDAKTIAFEDAAGRLEIVNVATGKVRSLVKLYFGGNVSWSSDSHELLVRTQPKRNNACASLWRVPADGAKPALLRSSC